MRQSCQNLPGVKRSCIALAALWITGCAGNAQHWQQIAAGGDTPTARHESAFVAHGGKLYMIGGRRINPTDVYDPVAKRWSQRAAPPIEIHHMQAVSYGDAIYLLGAFTGQWPNETPLDRVLKYFPAEDRYAWGHRIPAERQRGGAGAVVYNDRIYLIGGITDGHMSGSRAWLDEYDPRSGRWRVLPDAPNARDHVHAAVNDHKLYVFAGRRSSRATGHDMDLTVSHGNVFDFADERWQPVADALRIPTERAGSMVVSWGNEIIVAGGESGAQVDAHAEVEAYDVRSRSWRRLPDLTLGRHGTGLAGIGDRLFIAAGSAQRGGEPELVDLEQTTLSPTPNPAPRVGVAKNVYQRWHTVSLTFEGPATSETAVPNPFTDFRLQVEFTNGEQRYVVKGFYAADGQAADSSATGGNRWQVRFAPPTIGTWQYHARLRAGSDIVLDDDFYAGDEVAIAAATGSFIVTESDKSAPDFRGLGALAVSGHYFYTQADNQRWIKVGTNSPENLLAFRDFDATERAHREARDGEAAATGDIHAFADHLADWSDGDPTWGDGKGRALIGGVNYLADQGMNVAYFLTLNIGGDGNDVWPYVSPTDFERFDVSKLEQWERVFSHMQRRGIALHVVVQETENERLLDDGDTGRLRQLYFGELIARFAHHPGLIWNLGEENGPAPWSPHAQNTEQRKAMANYFKAYDPYQHPVLLHTHASVAGKQDILTALLGFDAIDGLSFQVDDPLRVNAQLLDWRTRSAAAGKPWLITMDEIGPWHTGAVPDTASNDNHAMLRQHALWGSLLAGGAGVEWYFGAHYPANDLTSEDWRLRDSLWQQTRAAKALLNEWALETFSSCNAISSGYCFGNDNAYLVYVPAGTQPFIDLGAAPETFFLRWTDPLTGRIATTGEDKITGADRIEFTPPDVLRDWLLMLTRQDVMQ
ncbi:MAG: DUF5060 domain-containing protein [Pseudomonadota bacterium]